jgi:hypothetical protein
LNHQLLRDERGGEYSRTGENRVKMCCLVQAVPYHLQRMEFGTEFNGTVNSFQMFWPIVIAHK